MKMISSTAYSTSRIVLTISAAVLVFSSVACSHKSPKDNATPAAAPVATATPVEAALKSNSSTEKDSSTKSATGTSITCAHGADSRDLAVEAKGSGCNTNYTKNGKTSSVANGTSGLDHCQKTVDKIRSKLEAAGYTCK